MPSPPMKQADPLPPDRLPPPALIPQQADTRGTNEEIPDGDPPLEPREIPVRESSLTEIHRRHLGLVLDERTESNRQLDLDDTPVNLYQVMWSRGLPVNVAAGRNSPVVATLQAGQIVNVLEVGETIEGRVRVKIEDPTGWTSLSHTQHGTCYLQPVADVKEKSEDAPVPALSAVHVAPAGDGSPLEENLDLEMDNANVGARFDSFETVESATSRSWQERVARVRFPTIQGIIENQKEDRNVAAAGISCLLALGIFILFCCCFVAVPQYRYGMKKRALSGHVDLTNVYEPGIYTIGFWKAFTHYPSTISTISYSDEDVEAGVSKMPPLKLRSKDKVSMTLEVSVQYTRRKDKLPELYMIARDEKAQERLFASKIRAELLKVMSNHESSDCWKKRLLLTQKFYQACQTVLNDVHADCWDLQFYRSTMTSQFESELIVTQVQKQEQRVAVGKQRAKIVQADTEVLIAIHVKDQTMIESAGAAARFQVIEAAKTEAEASRVNASAAVLRYVKDTLALAAGQAMTDLEFADYQERIAVAALQEAPFYYSLLGSPGYIYMPRKQAATMGAAEDATTTGAAEDVAGDRRLQAESATSLEPTPFKDSKEL